MAGSTDRGGRGEREIHPVPAAAPGNAPGLGACRFLQQQTLSLLFPAMPEDTGRAAEMILLCGGLGLSITQEQTGNALLHNTPLSSVIWHPGTFLVFHFYWHCC